VVVNATTTLNDQDQLYADYNGSGAQAMTWSVDHWTYSFTGYATFVAGNVTVTSYAASNSPQALAVIDSTAFFPPVAGNDTPASVQINATTNFDVLANDSDGGDGGALTVIAVSADSCGGTPSIGAGGLSVDYTAPGTAQTGCSFTYTLSDTQGTDVGTVTFDVIDSPPVDVTYTVIPDSGTNLGADGSTNASGDRPAVDARMLLSETGTNTGYSIRPSVSSGVTRVFSAYSPVFASTKAITNVSAAAFNVRGYNSGDNWTFHLYSYDPNGSANNRTLVGSSNTINSGTGSTVTVTPSYGSYGSVLAGHRLVLEIVIDATASETPRIYYDDQSGSTEAIFTVTLQ